MATPLLRIVTVRADAALRGRPCLSIKKCPVASVLYIAEVCPPDLIRYQVSNIFYYSPVEKQKVCRTLTSSLPLCLCHSALINTSRSQNSKLYIASETLDIYAGVTKIGITGQCTKLFLLRDCAYLKVTLSKQRNPRRAPKRRPAYGPARKLATGARVTQHRPLKVKIRLRVTPRNIDLKGLTFLNYSLVLVDIWVYAPWHRLNSGRKKATDIEETIEWSRECSIILWVVYITHRSKSCMGLASHRLESFILFFL